MQKGIGQAASAENNRRREVRLGIIHAFSRSSIPFKEWPDFIKVYYANAHQQNQYCQNMSPLPFQPPDFDRLNQSPEDWIEAADRAWALHRSRFLEDCESWVKMGVDEAIVWKERPRGPGSRNLGPERTRRRGDNTAINRRYEWAAQYLAGIPIKQIAEQADSSTVGRIARQILRSAGWPTRSPRKPDSTGQLPASTQKALSPDSGTAGSTRQSTKRR
jgi:hypothetical protein